jgi:hypothetical protein
VTPRLGMGNQLTLLTVYSVAKISLLSWGSELVPRALNVPLFREIILATALSSSMFFVPLINDIVLYLTYKYFCHRQVLELNFFCIHQPE